MSYIGLRLSVAKLLCEYASAVCSFSYSSCFNYAKIPLDTPCHDKVVRVELVVTRVSRPAARQARHSTSRLFPCAEMRELYRRRVVRDVT